MKNTNDFVKKGKHLSFLLRHDKEYQFDEHGYRKINDLIENHGFTKMFQGRCEIFSFT